MRVAGVLGGRRWEERALERVVLSWSQCCSSGNWSQGSGLVCARKLVTAECSVCRCSLRICLGLGSGVLEMSCEMLCSKMAAKSVWGEALVYVE